MVWEKKKNTFHYNKSGYPVSNRTGKLIHKSVADKKYGRPARSDEEDHHDNHNTKDFREKNIIRLKKKFHRKGHREGWL